MALVAAQIHLPGTSSVSTALGPPSACLSCHGGFDPEGSAYDTWAGSAMGHAARDPVFLSALSEAEKDVPGVGDFCLRCHAPEAWLQGRCFPTDGSALTPADSGVTCSVCHRMDPSPWQRNGQYIVANDLDMRGPYSDAVANHRVVQSDWISDSRMCGSCHDLRNPLVPRRDLDGTDMDMPFPEQLTYTEWATSAFANGGQTCQDCHMPEDEARVAEQGPVRPDRSSHGFAGGNAFLLSAIAFLEPGLGLSAQLARGQARVEGSLRRAAELELRAPPASVRRGQVVSLTFRVTNLTGHKLPTGYPEGRRVWLELRAPTLGVARGAFDESSGEPVAPAALYHSVQGRFGVGPGHRLALNDTIFEDTRIPPRGLVVTATTAPVGKTYPELSPGVVAHFDDVVITATVTCDASTEVARIDASLWYQSITKRYVDALVADNGNDPRGARLALAFEETDPGPIEMESLVVRIPIVADSICGGPDAGFASDSGSTDGSSSDSGAPGSDAGIADGGAVRDVIIDEGCSCESSGVDGHPRSALLVLSLAGVIFVRRRRRRARSSWGS